MTTNPDLQLSSGHRPEWTARAVPSERAALAEQGLVRLLRHYTEIWRVHSKNTNASADKGRSPLVPSTPQGVAPQAETVRSLFLWLHAKRRGLRVTKRIGRLEAANKVPASVKPDATWQQAVTIMLNNDAPRICASVVVLFPMMAHSQDHNQAGTCNLIERNIASSAKGDDQLASC